MSIDKRNFVNGITVTDADDASKKLSLEANSSQTANTKVTLKSNPSTTTDAQITLPSTTSTLASTAYVDNSSGAVQDIIDDHIADTTAAHAASAISTTLSNVQTDLNNLFSYNNTLDGVTIPELYADIATAQSTADGAVQRSIVTAKGDLLVASAGNTVTKLSLGTNGNVLIADDTQGTGIRWGVPAAAAGVNSINSLDGDVTITAGTNIQLNEVGNNIEILSTGVGSLNTLNGDLTISAGSFISISPTSPTDLQVSTNVNSLVSTITSSGLRNPTPATIAVNFDNSTIDSSGLGSTLRVKPLGITDAEVSATSPLNRYKIGGNTLLDSVKNISGAYTTGGSFTTIATINISAPAFINRTVGAIVKFIPNATASPSSIIQSTGSNVDLEFKVLQGATVKEYQLMTVETSKSYPTSTLNTFIMFSTDALGQATITFQIRVSGTTTFTNTAIECRLA